MDTSEAVPAMFQFDLLLNAHCKANSILILLHKNKGIGRLSSIRTRPSIWGVIGYRMVPTYNPCPTQQTNSFGISGAVSAQNGYLIRPPKFWFLKGIGSGFLSEAMPRSADERFQTILIRAIVS